MDHQSRLYLTNRFVYLVGIRENAWPASGSFLDIEE
jgi:hypothetical protein